MMHHKLRVFAAFLGLFAIAACDGTTNFTGTQNNPQPPTAGPPGPPAQGTYVALSSDADDWVGDGLDYLYTQADSIVAVTVQGNLLTVDVDGDEYWTGEFQLPDSVTAIETGVYPNLTRYPFHDAIVGGLSWSGEGRGCNTLEGSITIDSVTYDGDTLVAVGLSFEQYCEGNTPALRGEIRWDASDTTSPPGPAAQAPAGTWEPLQGTTPDTGNYVYLVSQQGDFIGQGADYLYTDATATISVSPATGRVLVSVAGPENWSGDFQGMNFLTQLEPGYYGDLQRYPFHNPVKGGLNWSGEGRGCNRLTGWFMVDNITFSGDVLTALDLRFEQHCEGDTPGLFGEIHWVQTP